MPVLDQPPSLIPDRVDATGNVKGVEQRSALVDTRLTPLQSLLTHIEGSIFVLTYYRQVVGAEDKLKALDLNTDPQYQEYEKIRGFETRLQGDFSFSVDTETQEKTLTGNTIIYPSIKPNFGDMFYADTGDGRKSLFTVTEAEPLSWRMQTCYRINFAKVQHDTKEHAENLELKTTRRYTFVKGHVEHGKYPILADERYTTYRLISRTLFTIESEYLRNFFSEVIHGVLVPAQGYVLFDPFINKAVMALLTVRKHALMRRINSFNLENDPAFRMTTIWDSLLMVEPSHLHVCAWRMGAVQKGVMFNSTLQGGLFWSEVDRLFYPLDTRTDADIQFGIKAKGHALKLRRSAAPITDFDRLVIEKDFRSVETVEDFPEGYETPDIHRVTIDEMYVFSKAFYEQKYEKMSRLERLVWSFLNHEEIDVEILEELMRGSAMWDKLERFYYVPVLIILCTVALRGPSSE